MRTFSTSDTHRRRSVAIPVTAALRTAAGQFSRRRGEPLRSSGPNVVRPIVVDQPLLRIELDLCQLLLELVSAHIAGCVRAPALVRIDLILLRAVGEGEPNANRQHATSMVHEQHAY